MLVRQDMIILRYIINCGKSVTIAVNKWDLIKKKDKKKIKNYINSSIKTIDRIEVCYVSASLNFGVKNLLHSVRTVYLSSNKIVNTSLLTNILRKAIEHHPPLTIKGKKIKLKYANLGGYSPLKVIIHGNQLEKLPNSYIKYLENYFKRELDLYGVSVKFFFKNSINPYNVE